MQDKQDKSTVQIQKTNLLLDFFPRRVEVTRRGILCTRLVTPTLTIPRFTFSRDPGVECDCACK
jgi:hypothetical protein